MILLLVASILVLVYSQEALENPKCNGWLDPGECNNFTVKWYYDRYDHRCRRFFYGGCGGNENNFNSLEDCSSSCSFREATRQDRCEQPHDPGTCQSDIERWFFDWDKKQCVCSWWTGCGGNSNRYYSYPHCMQMCGEFAEHGPGIDENYWGKLNGTAMSFDSQNVFNQYASNDNWSNDNYQTAIQSSWDSVENYRDVVEGAKLPNTQDGQNTEASQVDRNIHEAHSDVPQTNYDSMPENNEPEWSVPEHTPAISWAEFHGVSDPSLTNQRRAHQDPANEIATQFDPRLPNQQREHQDPNTERAPEFAELRSRAESIVVGDGNWENKTHGNGQHVYRFDSGPQVKQSVDGSVTTNRQVLVILEDKRPRVAFQQNRPQSPLELSKLFPAAPYSTMISPFHRKSKKMRKQKIPPRQITPAVSPTGFYVTYRTDGNGNRIRENVQRQTYRLRNSQPQSTQNYLRYPSRRPITHMNQPKQFYATYKTDKYGRGIYRNKISWTGSAQPPLSFLPPEFQRVMAQHRNHHSQTHPHPQRTAARPRANLATPHPPRNNNHQHAAVQTPTRTRRPVVQPPTHAPTPQQTRRTQATPTHPRGNAQATPTQPRSNVERHPAQAPSPQTRSNVQRQSPTRIPFQYIRPTLPLARLPRPTEVERRTIIPTVILPTVPVREVPEVVEATTKFTPTAPPTMRVEAEPMEYARPLIQRLTTPPPLSLDDIIAMDSQIYDEYNMDDDKMEYETTISQVLLPLTTPPPRLTPPPPPRQTPPPRQAPPSGWAPIVLPPKDEQTTEADDFVFDIQPVNVQF